ncbi:MMPL family transporter [Hoylesella enoeca]|uniref:MMPL family transporter n=1 Tax=Hoylesella enoeca TaxID=76123 RepID=UPI00288A7E1D|nr:MMPL family transporter [Hoylesella enoeca]
MTTFVLRLYDYLHRNRWLCYVLLAAIVVGSVLLTLRLRFNEDISDFLPNDEAYQKSMSIYRQINAADRIFVVFQLRDSSQTDTEKLISAVELFGKQTAGEHWKMTAQVDYDKLINIASFVYRNAPLFLTAADYKRMERQLAPDSIASALQRAQEQLLFPTGSLVSNNIQRDPLGLFTPLITRLQTANSNIRYTLNDGFIFTPDNKRAIIMIDSPYGSSETSKNSMLINRVNTAASAVEQAIPGVQIQATGAPVIAVQNARQIKTDSLWAVSIAAVLILSLLFYALRSLRKMLFIVVSLAFGWLIAMAGMSVLHQHVSVIVLGIASIIIGIAVNYPLHFVAHLSHQPSPRAVLQDIAEPLVIGNITTVGAFCALIPLDSTALRDLGIFAALMLMGTILFVMVFLPHLCKQNTAQEAVGQLQEEANETAEYIPTYPRNKWVVGSLIIITLVLGYFSLFTSFDTNMQNINYLKSEQRELLAHLSKMRNETPGETQLYVVSDGATVDQALMRSEQDAPDAFVTSQHEQQRRIDRWHNFVRRNHIALYETLPRTATQYGFSTEAFADFDTLLNTPFHPQNIDFFAPLTANGIGTRIIGHTAVRVMNVPNVVSDSIITAYSQRNDGRWAFDVQSMNNAIATSLSDNFNYIGWACGLIVFVFLWLSFGKFVHALIAFMPMAVSWLWILGTMHLLGIRFNLVNIILATFIFGQGDDYSIFITEGLIYERTHHRRILASYKRSIMLSAAVMFIGMGTLIVARHPALHSLGEITIVGMASVVAMTYVLPPIVFGWYVRKSERIKKGKNEKRKG